MKKFCRYLTYITFAASCIPAGYWSIDLGGFQLSAYRIGLVLLTFLCVIANPKRNPDKSNLKYLVFYVLWVVYAVISLAWVEDTASGIKQIIFLVCAVLDVWVAISFLTTREDVINVFRCFECMILFHSVVGWYEIITRNYLFASIEKTSVYTNYQLIAYRIPLSMFGENEFAVFMLLGICIEYTLINVKKGRAGRLFSIMLLLNCIALIFAGQTRSVWLAFFIVAAVFCIMTKRGKLVIPIAALSTPILFQDIGAKIGRVLRFNFAGTGSDSLRLHMIMNGWDFFLMSWGFGIGAGQFEYYVLHYARYYYRVTNAHNFIIEILANYGLLVTSAYLILYAQLVIKTMRKYLAFQDAIALSMLCYLASNVFVFITSSSIMGSELQWVVMAVIIAYCAIGVDKVKEQLE